MGRSLPRNFRNSEVLVNCGLTANTPGEVGAFRKSWALKGLVPNPGPLFWRVHGESVRGRRFCLREPLSRNDLRYRLSSHVP